MSERLMLFLPPEAVLAEKGNGCEAPFWARFAGGALVASGRGDGWMSEGAELSAVVAVAPAGDAPVRFVHVDQALPAQASAAARIDALNAVLGDRSAAHVAAAVPSEVGQSFAVCVTRQSAMAAWTDWLAAKSLAVEAIVPAALLVPPPEGDGLSRALLGDETVMRSARHGYASDAAIDALMGDGALVRDVDGVELELALAFAAEAPPLNLLSGAWAVKQGWGFDAGVMRWVKRLALLLLALTLAVPLVQAVKLARDTSRADAAVVEMVAAAGVQAGDAVSAEAAVDRRLGQVSGGALAFSVPASALYAALAEAPAVSLKSLVHRGDGTLTAMIAGPRVEDVNPVLIALQARGYKITAQPLAGSDGQQMANVTIRAVP
jgi:general secretion pathway protein L